MTTRILDYPRRDAIAVTALGCSLLALGGASYAAVNLPNNSVGTAQLRNGAVTPPKLNHGSSAAMSEPGQSSTTVASSSHRAEARGSRRTIRAAAPVGR